MPFYDFYCKECEILAEDEFFKIADEKDVKCEECGKQMDQVILKAPGLRDPGGVGRKWTNDGYQILDKHSGELRTVTEKWAKGKNMIRSDVHASDPNPNTRIRQQYDDQVKHETKLTKKLKNIAKNLTLSL